MLFRNVYNIISYQVLSRLRLLFWYWFPGALVAVVWLLILLLSGSEISSVEFRHEI